MRVVIDIIMRYNAQTMECVGYHENRCCIVMCIRIWVQRSSVFVCSLFWSNFFHQIGTEEGVLEVRLVSY